MARKNPENKWKCEDEYCRTEFIENDILYKCEECNNFYCFKCFCKNHYKKHKIKWLEYEIKYGKPVKPREPSGPLKV